MVTKKPPLWKSSLDLEKMKETGMLPIDIITIKHSVQDQMLSGDRRVIYGSEICRGPRREETGQKAYLGIK